MSQRVWVWSMVFGLTFGGLLVAGCGTTSSPSASRPGTLRTVDLSVAVQFPNATPADATKLVIPDDTARIDVSAVAVNSDVFPYVLDPPLELTPANPTGTLPAVPIGAELSIVALAFNASEEIIATGASLEVIGETEPREIALTLEAIAAGIQIADANLEAIVRIELGLSASEPITPEVALELTTLNASESNISSLAGLQFFENLTVINLRDNLISDIEPLAENSGLASGTQIDLRDNPLSSEARDGQIPELETRGIQVLVTPVATDIQIVDANLEAIVRSALGLSASEPITDVRALELTTLSASESNIASVEGLEFFENLTVINLRDNAIADLQPLLQNQGLGSGVQIDLRENPLLAIARETQIPDLEARGIEVLVSPTPEENAAITQANLTTLIDSNFPDGTITTEQGTDITLAGAIAFGNGLASTSALTFEITNNSSPIQVFSAADLGCAAATTPGVACNLGGRSFSTRTAAPDRYDILLIFRDAADFTYEFPRTVIITPVSEQTALPVMP